MFVGFVDLDGTLTFAFTVRDPSNEPSEPDSAPTFRVYGPGGLIELATRTASVLDTVDITDVGTDTPITVTAEDHGLFTGDTASVSGVVGATAANGTWVITRVDDDSFTLDDSTGGGSYVSGGTAHVTGLYQLSVDATAASGFERGEVYTIRVLYAIDGTSYVDQFSFQVT